MVQLVLIGLGAGTASALLLSSVASGSPLSVLLFYLAPLPILIAALGFSHWAALVAAIVAAACLAAVFGVFFFVAFVVGVGLPAWWLGYLALLARPSAAGGLEWYPVGSIVFWAAMLAAAVVIAAMLQFGTDIETFQASLRKGLERALQGEDGGPPAGRDFSRLIDVLLSALPPVAAVVTTLVSVVNLWLAERVARISGRLQRPPPELSAMRLPGIAGGLTAGAIAASFLPGMPGMAAGVLGAALLMAFAIVGFAVLHAITRGRGGRPFTLGGVYAAVALFGWPVLGLSLLGLIDSAIDLRARMTARPRPPQRNP